MDYTKVTASNSETLKPQKQFENRLLAVLAETTEGACVAAHLTPIELTPGQILHHAEQAIEDVYFPLTVILSCVYNSENGVSLEVGTIGNNGLAGISIALGTNRTPYATEVARCRVQTIPEQSVTTECVRPLPTRRTNTIFKFSH